MCVLLFPEMMIRNLQAVYLDKINISQTNGGCNGNTNKCNIRSVLAAEQWEIRLSKTAAPHNLYEEKCSQPQNSHRLLHFINVQNVSTSSELENLELRKP